MTRRCKWLTGLLFTSVLLLFGCDEEVNENYDLTVRWNISGMPLCRTWLPADEFDRDDLTFDVVEISVYADETAQTAIQPPVRVSCEDFQYTIPRLERGRYYVIVDALTQWADQEVAFFSGADSVAVNQKGATMDIPLIIGTGEVRVIWRFESGRICGAVSAGEVKQIEVTMDQQIATAACGDGQLMLTGVPAGGEYTIEALALSADGEVLFETSLDSAPMELLPGLTYEVELVF
jgi:hypothetical protein